MSRRLLVERTEIRDDLDAELRVHYDADADADEIVRTVIALVRTVLDDVAPTGCGYLVLAPLSPFSEADS